jgi:DNA-binding response OmpR family regulator
VWPPSGWIIRDVLAGTDYEITEAEDGEHALAAVAKQRPDLILMEIQLPSMDGYDQSTKFLFAVNHQTARARYRRAARRTFDRRRGNRMRCPLLAP